MKNFNDRLPGKVLTVIIRDDSPMIHCQDAPKFRSVRVILTDDQVNLITLGCTGTTGGTPIYEVVSKCFIEPEAD